MKRVLFLCSQNSARSQMAEGFLRAFAPDRFEVQSAGTRATRVRSRLPRMVKKLLLLLALGGLLAIAAKKLRTA